jgi:hypothetical protein
MFLLYKNYFNRPLVCSAPFPLRRQGFFINVDINTSLLNTLVFVFQALGGDRLLMESALVLRAGKEWLFLSVRGSKGVWGMEDPQL